MRKISLLAVSMVFAGLVSMSANAQTGTALPGAGKVALVDSAQFANEKEGVTRYLNALKALKAEIAPKEQELTTINTRLKTLSEDIAKMTSNTSVPINQESVRSKQDEGQRLQREFDFKKKEFEAYTEKRGSDLLGPVQNDIFKAIQDFATQKGYLMILDIDKLVQQGALMAMDPKAEVTKEFITYFNARPATAASSSVPK